MANISKYPDHRCDCTAAIVLNYDSEITHLPTSVPSIENPAVQGYYHFDIGSTAFAPSSKNALMLTSTGWVKIT